MPSSSSPYNAQNASLQYPMHPIALQNSKNSGPTGRPALRHPSLARGYRIEKTVILRLVLTLKALEDCQVSPYLGGNFQCVATPETSEEEKRRKIYAYVCGIAPTAVFMTSVFFGLATVAAAGVDERFWGDNCHFEI